MVKEKDRGMRSGKMELYFKVSITTIRKMDLGNLNGLMDHNIKVNSKII